MRGGEKTELSMVEALLVDSKGCCAFVLAAIVGLKMRMRCVAGQLRLRSTPSVFLIQ